MSLPRILIIFTLLFPALVTASFAQDTDPTESNVALTSQDARASLIPHGSNDTRISFLADPDARGGDVIDIMISDPTVGVSLILPSGDEITSSNAEALGFTFNVTKGEALIQGLIPMPIPGAGIHTIIELPAGSIPGTYQAKLNASSTTVDAVALVTYYSSSSTRAAVTTDLGTYKVGDTIIVTALLFDGTSPLLNSTVNVSIADSAHPEIDPVQIILQDSGDCDFQTGDGLYTGTLLVDHAGKFSVGMRATGQSTSGISFSRAATTSFKVISPLASFVSFQDASINNANGFIDRLNLNANLDVQTAGDYKFIATLLASNGGEISNSVQAHLDAGNQLLSLPFPADSVFSLGADGPYQIKNALLVFKDEDNSVADSRADAGNTAAYQLSLFNASNASDLSVTSVGEPTSIRIGEQLSYSLVVYNIGALTATNVTLSDQLPDGITLNSIATEQGDCSGTGLITCSLGDIASNESAVVTIVATPTTIGTLTNSANAATSARDFNLANNSATSIVRVVPLPTAQFVGIDATTQGSWKGSYGSDGYNVVNDRENYPSYATVQPTGQSVITNQDPSDDIRALQKSDSSDRIAAAWFASGDMPIEINFTDGSAHRLTLYVLDWDYSGRSEQIEISDPVTNQVLDNRAVSNYAHGKYLAWNLSGGVRITITNTGPQNAVVNGIFFDSVSTTLPQPPAYTISGTIADSSGSPLSNVPVAVTGSTVSYGATTGGDGRYSVTNVVGGADYVVRPLGSAAPFTPATRTVSYLSANVVADFTGTPLVSGNGRIAFTSLRGATVGTSTIKEDGSARQDIPNGFVNERSPAWSPDGNRIAFFRDVYADGNYHQKIFVMNADGTDVVRLTDGLRAGRPAWSPDGSKIAFADQTENGLEIFVMNADGTGQTAITNDNNNYAPAWSPDGSKIAFVSERDFDREIYVMNGDGSNQTRLTFSPQDDLNPAWSPDGSRIAFDSFRDFNQEIYVMNADGSNQINITNDAAIDAEPAWSPDGTKIAFSSFLRSSNGGIYVMNTDGTNPVALTNTGDEWPAWTASAGLAPTPTPTPTPSPTPKASTSMTVISSLNPSVSGQLVTFTATVTSSVAVTGQVQFFDGSILIGAQGAGGNTAVLSTATLTPGTHTITTIYDGDANSESSTSPPVNQIVLPVLESLTLGPKSVAGSNPSTGSVSLTGPAPPGGIIVALTGDNSLATAPQTVAIAAGADTATFTITTTEVTANSTAHLSATWNGTTKKATLTVLPFALKSLTVTPASVTGGTSATGKVTLNGTAPAGGKLVTLGSDNTVAATPENVTVVEGSSTATFTITTTAVDADTLATLSATFNGVTKTDTLAVKEPIVKSVKLSPASLTGGASSTGTITLSGAAPTGGTTVSLTGNNVAATLPASLMVAEGTTVATFSINTSPVSNDVAVSITAMAEDTVPRTATLTIKAPAPTSLSLNPGSVVGGSPSTATVNLSGIAPAGGIEVTLSSADSAATVPATIIIAEGQNTTTFAVTTTPEPVNHVVAISASRGAVTRTTNLTVKAPAPNSLSLTPSIVTGGSTSAVTLTLTGPAPEEGIEIPLSTANAAAVVPPSVSVPPGETTITFSIGTTSVVAQTTGNVSATYNGVTRSDSLTIKPPVTSSVALNPTQVGGGATVAGTVTLTGPAPAGGAVVQLTSSKTAVATVPANVTVAPGDTTATFAITTNTVTTSQSATISATLNGVKKSATLSVVPVALSYIGANPASIRVGDSTFLTVTLNGPAPTAGFVVSLSSSNPTALNVPGSVTIPAGTSSITITVSASALGSTNVTASANGASYVVVVTAGP